MIRVNIELLPYGIEEAKESIGWIELRGKKNTYEYTGEFTDENGALHDVRGKVECNGNIMALLGKVVDDYRNS